MANLLLDTDVFVRHIRGTEAIRPRGNRIFYSVVTRAELFAGGGEGVVRRMLEPYTEIDVDRRVAERAGRLLREHGVPMPDALIAATAREHSLTMVTRNVRDFERVPRLRVREEV